MEILLMTQKLEIKLVLGRTTQLDRGKFILGHPTGMNFNLGKGPTVKDIRSTSPEGDMEEIFRASSTKSVI